MVSIRAPVKGATMSDAIEYCETCVSIRAPVKGATQVRPLLQRGRHVSIRAPVKGATTLEFLYYTMDVFQSAPP